ncbi:uncharacterized protein LOC108935825 [Arapaima gigas]
MKGVLYLVCVALWRAGAATVSPDGGPGEQVKIASTDDVNVLMYGVMQFSEVLHNTYQNTDNKVGRIASTLHHQEGALTQLEKEAREASHTEQLIRYNLDALQTQTVGLQMQTKQLNGALSKVEQEEAELQTQVTSLEANLQRTIPGKIRALKELTLQNSGALKILMKWIQEQKQGLEDQNQHLAYLQGMVHKSAPQT